MDVLPWYRRQIPKGDQWSDKQKALQLHDVTVYEEHIRDLTSCDLEHEQTFKPHASRSLESLVLLARNYSGTTEKSWAYLKKWELLLSFRRLILFSICLVLSEQGDSKSEIVELMWWTRADEKKRKSILKGTRWVHRTILTLVRRGWNIARATELFLLVPLSNERLVQLAPKLPSDFLEGIDNPDDATQKPFLTPHFTFPTLIEELCKNCSPALAREQICAALGYEVPLPTQHFSHVSLCKNIITPELQIELVTPAMITRPAAANYSGDLPLQKRRKRDVVPALNSPNSDGSLSRDPLMAVHSSKFNTELADFLTLIRHLRVETFEEDLLLIGTDIQYNWDDGGNQRAVDLKDSGLSEKPAIMFRNKQHLSGLLRSSVRYGLLQERPQGQKRIYHVTGHSSDLLDNEDPHLDSLTFLCHICPKDEAFSQKFFATIKLLRPALTSWFRYLLERPEVLHSMPSHDNLTAACITILRHNSSGPPNEAVLLLEHFCVKKVSVHSKLAIAVAQSALLRKQLQYDVSDHVVHKALLDIHGDNIYQDYLLGQLYLSLVENSILRNEHTTALEWVNNISLSTEKNRERKPPLMWRLFEQKWTAMGRIYRFIGEFKEAKAVLEPCLIARQHLATNKLVAIARQLADVYVELGEIGSAEMLLNHHLNILQKKGRQDSIPYIRLLLSYADVELRLGQLGPAKARLQEVRTWFEAHSPTTPTDQLDHVRALIACMRINLHERRWSEVLEWSTAALRLADQYASFTVTNHYKGYIRKVRAISHLQLAQADMRAASECVSEPRHYMTGVGTYDRVKAHEELCKALATCTSFDLKLLDIV